MKLLLLLPIAGGKALLCKGFALGSILLLFWWKGRQLQFQSDAWDAFFASLPAKKVQSSMAGIYLGAAALSSAVSCLVLEALGYRHSLAIAALLFAGGAVITGIRWRAEGAEHLSKRYEELSRTILEKQEKDRISQ